MTLFNIPKTFYNDHSERGLPSPTVVTATKRHYRIRLADTATAELLDDARHYASDAIDTKASPHLMGLKSSARSTVRAIEAAMGISDV